MIDFEKVFGEIYSSPFRSCTWQLIVAYPELYSDEGLDFLEKNRHETRARKDHSRVSDISMYIHLFNRCREAGTEQAFFGTMLSDKCREAFSRPSPVPVVNKSTEAKRLAKAGAWRGSVELLESILSNVENADEWRLRAELSSFLAYSLLRNPKGNRADNLERVIELSRRTSRLWDRLGMPVERAKNNNNLAIAYQNRLSGDHGSNIETALELYAIILKDWRRETFPFEWATALSNMSVAYRRRPRGSRSTNLERAIELGTDAAAVWNREEFPNYWAQLQHNRALVYKHRLRGDRSENIEKAIACYEAALTIWTFEAHPFRWSSTANNMAAGYVERIQGERSENIETAIRLYKGTLQVRTKEAFPKNWADTKSNLALCYKERPLGNKEDNLERAIGLLEETLEVRNEKDLQDDFTATLINLGSVYSLRMRGDRQKNLERSEQYYDAYLLIKDRVKDPRNFALALNYRAMVLTELVNSESGDSSDRAVDLLHEAMDVLSIHSFPRERRGTAINLSGILLEKGCWREALEAVDTGRRADQYLQKQATSLTGRIREIEEGAVLYYQASLASARLGDIVGALDWLEQGRTRELGESLERDRMLLYSEIPEEDQRSYLDIVEKLRDLEAEQRGAVPGERPFLVVAEEAGRKFGEFEKLITKIQSYAPEFFRTESITDSFVEVLLKDEKTCFFVCNVTDHGSAVYLFAMSGGSLFAEASFSDNFTTGRLTEIAEAWTAGLKKIEKQNLGDVIEFTTRALHDELFAGAFDLLNRKFEGIKRLVLVPHLLLHSLPLHLMKSPSGNVRKYLLEDYELSFAPGINVLLAQTRTTPGRMDDALIITNPTDDLDWSMMEAESLEKHFPGRVRRLTGADATRAMFIEGAKEADVLHLACHGFFDPADPWSSGIILAGELDTGGENAQIEETGAVSRENRELLTLKEITYGIDLSGAELVVLSACETGLVSPGVGSDEFIGLPGGFLRAGARYVVASLWAVDDLSTSLLMAEFYRLMKEEGLPPHRALKEAQSRFINHRSWNNPYYWGAFRFFGM